MPKRLTMAQLEERLREAEETLDAIRLGHVDALVVQGPAGEQVFTLKGADHRYRQLVETMNEGALMTAADGTIVYGNARFAALVGAPLETLMGSSLLGFVTPASARVVEALLQAAPGAPRKAEVEVIRGDGARTPVYLSATPGWDEDERLICVIATDLSDQKRTQELVATEQLTARIVDQAAEGIVVCNLEGIVIRASRAAHRAAGTNPLLRPFAEVFDLRAADSEGPGHGILTRALRGETESRREVVLLRPDTEPMDLLLSAGPIMGNDGEPLGCVITFIDVTDRKRAAEERLQLLEGANDARIEAELANRAKDEFLAMLGHELRNPLAPIATALELMEAKQDPAFARERDVIARQLKHVVRLVDDLLDVSRIAQGKVELDLRPRDLEPIIAKAIEASNPIIEERGHRLEVELEPGVVLCGDEVRLCQVISNLLTNAAKYTERGGLIQVRGFRDGDEVVVTVRDNGMGIPPELLPNLFELFVQGVRTIERSEGGLGLGLSIVRSLVQQHGGSVAVRSDGVGQGSEFEVRIPAVTDAPAAAAEPAGPSTPVQGLPAAKRVLVVDDNVDAALLIGEALSAFGYVTQVAHDGPSALAIAESFQPEVGLLDIGLPVMDGHELARRLRERRGDSGNPLHLVALTGYGQASDRERSAAAGFDEHLVKPVDLYALDKLLKRLG